MKNLVEKLFVNYVCYPIAGFMTGFAFSWLTLLARKKGVKLEDLTEEEVMASVINK